MKKARILSLLLALVLVAGLCTPVMATETGGNVITESAPDSQGIITVTQTDGPTLAYHRDSGVTILKEDGYAFKDLNQNGTLDAYEDWRLSTAERADNLAGLMIEAGTEGEGIQSIAGLMLYSSHTNIIGPNIDDTTLFGMPVDIRDALDNQYLRHVLVVEISSAEDAASWSNNVQAHVEDILWGIPTNNSSDPRHTTSTSDAEYVVGAGELSIWPATIGLAATFDEDLVEEAGQIQSTEYRALGISTALSPQIDTGTDPRWYRMTGTFGEDASLSTALARAFVDGWQTDEDSEDGWGYTSVNAMVKHWPGGGSGEGGRDAHYNYGKFAVYPGDNFAEHLLPFTEGAFKLEGGTGMASAVMPYYTISWDQDDEYGENVGNAYSRYIISDLLRDEYKYEGVVCTDWGITTDANTPWSFGGMCWGMENVTVVERFVRLLEVGVDQFGGVNEIDSIMAAYDYMVEENGKMEADAIMKQSAERLLANIFNVGLFENPYLDVEDSVELVGNADYMATGYAAQQQSVVMLKNTDGVISADGLDGKIYVDETDYSMNVPFGGTNSDASKGEDYGTMTDELKTFYAGYFEDQYTEDLDEADVLLIVMDAPTGGLGFSLDDFNGDGNGYQPITLQYSPYTATTAREESLAATTGINFAGYDGDDVENRSYKDKTYANEGNVDRLAHYYDLIDAAGEDVTVIVYMRATNPMVWSEIEPYADAIVLGYTVQTQAALDIITGQVEPSAMLPIQQPANMETVEAQYEDVGHDMYSYIDADGNVYDFGFGLNWSGVIGVDTTDSRYDEFVDGWGLDFDDVNRGDWFYTAVYYSLNEGLMTGAAADRFDTDSNTTRAMFVTVLGRWAEVNGEEITGDHNFTDVGEDYYTPYIGWAASKGIVNGYDENTFGTDDPVTREQMAALITRFADYMDIELGTGNETDFSDADQISEDLYNEVMIAAAAGIINGNADGTFAPLANAQRSQMAQLFYNFFSQI